MHDVTEEELEECLAAAEQDDNMMQYDTGGSDTGDTIRTLVAEVRRLRKLVKCSMCNAEASVCHRCALSEDFL